MHTTDQWVLLWLAAIGCGSIEGLCDEPRGGLGLINVSLYCARQDELSRSPQDRDGDGWEAGTDCDDDNRSAFPGAAWAEDPTLCMEDADGDGWGASLPTSAEAIAGTDCDDDDRSAFPGAAWAEDPTLCMKDADGDGWGSPQPAPGVAEGTDCDDGDPGIYPGACEICGDGIDQDCSGSPAECHPRLDASYRLGQHAVALEGEAALDNAGISVSSAGDFDGDGRSDLLIGASRALDSRGSAYLVLSSTLAERGSDHLSLGEVAIRYDGEIENDRLGVSVSSVDFDSDGDSDLLLGAKNHDGIAANGGAVYVVPGGNTPALGPQILSEVVTIYAGTEESAAVGFWVTGLESFGGAGDNYLAVGGPMYGAQQRGSVYLVRGRALQLGGEEQSIWEEAQAWLLGANGDQAGSELQGAGDVDGDGLQEMIVSALKADNRTGRAYIVQGDPEITDGFFEEKGWTFVGSEPGELAGSSVAGGGDVDGDGLDDVLIGARADLQSAPSPGRAFLVTAARMAQLGTAGAHPLANEITLIGEVEGDRLGQAVSIPGDLDCDGFDDLLIGADRHKTDKLGFAGGAAYVVFGPLAGGVHELATRKDVAVYGHSGLSNDRLGSAVAAAGDVDGDGVPDMIVGSYTARVDGDRERGRAWLLFGSGLR
ncbi:MAG TPA: hypothetical protein ENK18_19405 [Deltaproteobacteria bacterium]|nr:hypothetical protein [Deltaproteobacteria bacterium]